MLQRVKDVLGKDASQETGDDEDGDVDGYRDLVEEQERLIRDLRSEIDTLRQEQREIEQDLNETQVRNDFKRIQLSNELQALRDRTNNTLDATEQQIQDVAIEEKVDVSSLSEKLQQLQADAADTGDVREHVQTLHDYVDAQYESLKEDITTLDTAIHDTVEEMRHDLVDSFRKEFLALETVLTYELDALEAKDRWAREDLEDRISALRESVREDLAELETETISLLKTNTAALEDELDQRTDSLSRAQDALEAQLNGRLDDMKAEVQEQLDALPDVDALEKVIQDTSEAQGNIAELRDDVQLLREELEDQQDQIDAAREDLQDSLDSAMNTIREQDVQPLKEAMETFREQTTDQIKDLENTVQDEIEQLARQRSAKTLGLERRLSQLEQRIDQELAAGGMVQTARRREVQEALEGQINEQADDIDALRNGISKALNMIENVDDSLSDVRSQIKTLADADDVDTLRERVDLIREALDKTATLDELEQLQERVSILQYAVDAVDARAAEDQTVDALRERVDALDAEKADTEIVDGLRDLVHELDEKKASRDIVEQLQHWINELEDGKADTDVVAGLKEYATQLQYQIDAVDAEKATAGAVEELNVETDELRDWFNTVSEEKADRTEVAEQLDSVSGTLADTRSRMEDIREDLDERLDALADRAADADTVDELDDRLDKLAAISARQDDVQQAITAIRKKLVTLHEENITEEDVEYLEKRLQKLREQDHPDGLEEKLRTQLQRLDQLERRAERTVDERGDGDFARVSRDEFEDLYRQVDKLSRIVEQLVSQGVVSQKQVVTQDAGQDSE